MRQRLRRQALVPDILQITTIWDYNLNGQDEGGEMLKRLVVLSLLILLPVVSFNAKGKALNKKDLMDCFAKEELVELVLAGNKGDIKKIDELVAKGVDVNYRGKKNITPLYAQMPSMNIEGFKRLLEHGADPNIPMEDGYSVIWLAASAGAHTDISIKLLKLCLEHGGDPNWVFHKKYKEPNHTAFEDGWPLITGAIVLSDRPIEVIKLLLQYGADINLKDERGGRTPLMGAVPERYDIAYFLLQTGADFTAKDIYGNNSFSAVICQN